MGARRGSTGAHSSRIGDDSSPRVRFERASALVCPLRSPNSSNANNARNVNLDGSLNNNNAYNGNRGVRPASVETEIE